MTKTISQDNLVETLPDMEAIRQSLITKVQGKRRDEAMLPQKSRDALLQQMTSPAKEGATHMVIDQPYSPCLKLAHELKPITIAELKLETHHHDRVLRATRVGTSASRHGSAHYIVEDATGVEVLVLDFLAFPDDFFVPFDAQVSILQPYFKIGQDRTAHLSVAHPYDISE